MRTTWLTFNQKEKKTMQIKQIAPEQLVKVRQRLIRFFQLYGDKRITKRALNWLEEVMPNDLSMQGNCLLVCTEGTMIVGAIAVANYGRGESFIAVKPTERQKGTGRILVEALMCRMEKMYTRVALDNTPSLKLCFSVGMVGFKMITGPTGKPTLWLGLGNWCKEDVEAYE
jgi:ribosomal protein S18 acetylase RimI-like enzyme